MTDLPYEACIIALVAIFLVQALLALCCMWSVWFLAFMTCSEVNDIDEATIARFVPTPNNGSSELVAIRKKSSCGQISCYFQKLKYIWDEDKKTFRGLQFPTNQSFTYYLNWKGHEDETALSDQEHTYGNNMVDMSIPEFWELFKERAIAPFFVFQVFCVGLWCLDEYWYYSVFTLMMLVMFECTLVKQQMRNMSEIRNMGNKPYQIQVYRCRRWRGMSSDQLVVGDIISITRSQNDNLVPCDLLLLRGQCIVDESMLTGESVPQMKEPLENGSKQEDEWLMEESEGKLHMLYGGTKVMAQQSTPSKTAPGLRAPDNGCIAYVLRTGFNTSQGNLLRTILFGVKRVTANNLETLCFILFLLIFAIAASAYLWIKGTEDPERNRYKLFLECTLILTSVVPPELPIELSLAVNTSLLQLVKLAIFCTEPFRIPFAGKVEYCCFDKTGTLTSDNLIVEGIAGTSEEEQSLIPIEEAPKESVQVLATCHSLVMMDDGMIGDPLEKVTLTAMGWNLTKGDAVIPKKGSHPAIKIFNRHHFSSALKRMSVVAGYTEATPGNSDTTYIATVKGAPETLKSMFHSIPSNYDASYLSMSRKGARVLALGIKVLGKSMSLQQIQEIKRDAAESDLTFAGFVVISCPLKKDSKIVMKELINSSHHAVMITGDNPLTACHVAKELKFSKDKQIVILTKDEGANKQISNAGEISEDSKLWHWKTVDGKKTIPLANDELNTVEFKKCFMQLVGEYSLCITGEGWIYLQKFRPQLHGKIIPHVKVYARFAPKQKEHVITALRDRGFTVLMCGDGTNDVGALKHAQCGVAILSNAPKLVKKPDQENDPSNKKNKKEGNNDSSIEMSSKSQLSKSNKTVTGKRLVKRGATGPGQGSINAAADRSARQNAALQKMLAEIEEAEQAQVVKLGDASIAAPFTSKSSSIACVNHVIKQGRCTLVTTLQMFKILALNALVLAYSQSVLYLEGVKFSDGQATLQGLLLAGCFLFISRSKPLTVLSKQRPLQNIFNVYTILTVCLQFAVHFGSLMYLVNAAFERTPRDKDVKFPDLEKEFEPNLINSTVYIISMALQVATFAINYRVCNFIL